MPARPLTIWAVSDGRAGIENQVLGLAEAVARITPATVLARRIHYADMFDRLPTALKLWPDRMLRADSDSLSPPYPNIWIAAGRATIPHSLRMRERSGGKTLVVQLQDPKHDLRAFDLVIAPEHDHITGPNTLSLIGSTNRITPDVLSTALMSFQPRLEKLERPFVTVLIGGNSKAYRLDAAHARLMAAEIKSAVTAVRGSLLLTVSRRTPDDARLILIDALKDLPGIIHDSQGSTENPYFAFLAAADQFLVTEDSVNMATEAASTGKPVQIISLERRTLGSGEKFEDFHETLRARGVSHPFNGQLTGNGQLAGESYAPLNETQRAARHVLDIYTRKFAS